MKSLRCKASVINTKSNRSFPSWNLPPHPLKLSHGAKSIHFSNQGYLPRKLNLFLRQRKSSISLKFEKFPPSLRQENSCEIGIKNPLWAESDGHKPRNGNYKNQRFTVKRLNQQSISKACSKYFTKDCVDKRNLAVAGWNKMLFLSYLIFHLMGFKKTTNTTQTKSHAGANRTR